MSPKAVGSTAAQLSWKKVANASGYEIYRSTAKKGTYKKVASVNSAGKVSYKDTKLKAGKTYYYKVRAGKTVGGKKYHGGYSDSRRVTT